MAELEFDQLVLRYCRQIIMKTMDHVRGAMRGQNRLHLKQAVADPQLHKSAQNLTKAVDRDAEDLILDGLQQEFAKLPGVKAYTVVFRGTWHQRGRGYLHILPASLDIQPPMLTTLAISRDNAGT